MPVFKALPPERIQELTRSRSGGSVDISTQKEWIARALAEAGGWGSIAIDPGDSVRTLKRRTTIAGKELNLVVKWHRKSTASELIFRAVEPGAVARRSRRARAEGQASATVAAEKPKRRSRKRGE